MKAILLILSTATSLLAQPLDLIEIDLKGTSINQLPVDVTILTDEPDQAIQAFEQHGAKRVDRGPFKIEFKGILYTFRRPSSYVTQDETKLKEGDVVYTFLTDHVSEKEEMLSARSLKKLGVLDLPTSPEIYSSEPGFYSIILTKTKYFTCSMHPQVHEDTPQKCSICGMKLIGMEKYE